MPITSKNVTYQYGKLKLVSKNADNCTKIISPYKNSYK